MTKREKFVVLHDMVEQVNFDNADVSKEDMLDFLDGEIAALDKKAATAKERAKQRKEDGDELRNLIFDCLSTENFMSVEEISAVLNDPDVSAAMIISRLGQLVKNECVEKESVTIKPTTENGKSRKATVYRAIEG